MLNVQSVQYLQDRPVLNHWYPTNPQIKNLLKKGTLHSIKRSNYLVLNFY